MAAPSEATSEDNFVPPGAQRYLLLFAVSLGALIGPLNSTMLAVALPEIRDAFSISHGAIGWLVSLYLIGMSVAQPLGGQLGDQLGRARVFKIALWLFLISSVGAAAAPWYWMLVAFRVAQALTASAVMPTGLAMLRNAVPVTELGRMNGLSGGIMSVSAAAGPVIGALAIALGSWRLLFLFNVPFVVLSLLLFTQVSYREVYVPRKPSIDWVGAGFYTALLVLASVLLSALTGDYPIALVIFGLLALLPLGYGFARQLRTHPTPAVDWRLFLNRGFSAASGNTMFVFLSIYLTLLTIPFFLVEVQDRDSTVAGYLLGGMSFVMAFVAPFSGRLADRVGRRLPSLAGATLVTVSGVVLVVGLSEGSSLLFLALALSLLGLGVGLSSGPATTAAIESVPASMAGSAAGTNAMVRYVASILGVGVMAAVLDAGDTPGLEVFRLILGLVTLMAVLATLASFFVHRFPPASPGTPSNEPSAEPAGAAIRP